MIEVIRIWIDKSKNFQPSVVTFKRNLVYERRKNEDDLLNHLDWYSNLKLYNCPIFHRITDCRRLNPMNRQRKSYDFLFPNWAQVYYLRTYGELGLTPNAEICRAKYDFLHCRAGLEKSETFVVLLFEIEPHDNFCT
uniref:Uncharacterized protein n=1 Tax=Romanomermis culicivorax TaxID=13658 RepID=A0A915K286_ROMCU